MCPGLAKADATATSDDGLSVLGAAWAHEIPRAERDRGWRSARETDRVAAARIGAFHGGAPERARFQGCSKGGRMAMRTALQNPEMFDGIISGAPAMAYFGLVGIRMSDLVQANGAGGAARHPGADDAALIGEATLSQRDAPDGAQDGAIADPAAGSPALAAPPCEDASDDACLTGDEMTALAAWQDGPRGGSGAQPHPGGVPVGSEAFWPGWLAGPSDDAAPLVEPFAANVLAGMAFPDDPGAGYDPRDFDAGPDPARAGCARPAAALPKAGQRERARS